METIFLLRHGETAWNKQRRVMGRLEIPLNRKGISQANRIARLLPNLEIHAIYSSPLKRALDTAQILLEQNKIPMKIDPELTEVDFGRWEGYLFDDLVEDETYRRFLRSPQKSAVPGGETIGDVQKRGLKAIQRAALEIPEGRLLFVSHGDVIRAILCHYLRVPLEEYRRLRIDNGSLSVLEIDGTWAHIKFINYIPDITHMGK
ncbi:MAG: histidine phosphatase family protein [Deltaproteobacteria bacterium]|nr:histidine phosphatase family protein [Deltaproteobacteria bacterium]